MTLLVRDPQFCRSGALARQPCAFAGIVVCGRTAGCPQFGFGVFPRPVLLCKAAGNRRPILVLLSVGVEDVSRPPPGVKMPVLRSAAFAVVVLLLGAGCVQTPPGPLPQANPSWSCTPVAGGTPYACYEYDYQQTSAQNKLYAEAEAVYRKFNAEDERIYRAGGVAEATQVLLETASGEFLDDALSYYRALRTDRTRLIEGRFVVERVTRAPNNVRPGTVATLEVCRDISDAVMKTGSGKPFSSGQDSVVRAYFVQSEAGLTIDYGENKWVTSC